MKPDEPIIIGCGPAGMACAIQLRRYGMSPLVLEQRRPGGLLLNANFVENYPGFPYGIPGPKLVYRMWRQARHWGVHVVREQVQRVEWDQGRGFVVISDRATRSSEYLVVASGTVAQSLPERIQPKVRHRVYTEVWPLLKKRRQRVVIVGAGDAAFDYALNLTKGGNFVTILQRKESVKCLSLLLERAQQDPLISRWVGFTVREVRDGRPDAPLVVEMEGPDGKPTTLAAEYVLFAIGRVLNLGFLGESVLEQQATLVAQGRLYLIGDVANGRLRQTAIAVGDGLRAAMQLYARMLYEDCCED